MAGFHGKIPSKGDFVSRGLSRDVIVALDDWFQTGMLASKSSLDTAWQAHYQVAPIWHYYISPGIIDDQAWLGIWIPSIDRVGRSFPLTMLAQSPYALTQLTSIKGFTDWFIGCEDLLLGALEPELNFPGFCQAVEYQQPVEAVLGDQVENPIENKVEADANVIEQAPEPLTLEQRLFELENAVHKIAQHLQLDVGLTPLVQAVEALKVERQSDDQTRRQPSVYSEFGYGINLAHSPDVLNNTSLSPAHEPFCLWLSEGNEAIDAQWVVTKGLPADSEFSQFLTGFK